MREVREVRDVREVREERETMSQSENDSEQSELYETMSQSSTYSDAPAPLRNFEKETIVQFIKDLLNTLERTIADKEVRFPDTLVFCNICRLVKLQAQQCASIQQVSEESQNDLDSNCSAELSELSDPPRLYHPSTFFDNIKVIVNLLDTLEGTLADREVRFPYFHISIFPDTLSCFLKTLIFVYS